MPVPRAVPQQAPPETYLWPPARPDPDLRQSDARRTARHHQDQYDLRLPLTYIPDMSAAHWPEPNSCNRTDRRKCAPCSSRGRSPSVRSVSVRGVPVRVGSRSRRRSRRSGRLLASPLSQLSRHPGDGLLAIVPCHSVDLGIGLARGLGQAGNQACSLCNLNRIDIDSSHPGDILPGLWDSPGMRESRPPGCTRRGCVYGRHQDRDARDARNGTGVL